MRIGWQTISDISTNISIMSGGSSEERESRLIGTTKCDNGHVHFVRWAIDENHTAIPVVFWGKCGPPQKKPMCQTEKILNKEI